MNTYGDLVSHSEISRLLFLGGNVLGILTCYIVNWQLVTNKDEKLEENRNLKQKLQEMER